MKKTMIIVISIIALGAIIYLGWFFLMKKNSEGGSCTSDKRCTQDLKCINKICSSGNVGSVCIQKSGCQTKYCINKICTNGEVGEVCNTYKDCTDGLLCKKSICAQTSDYSKYFQRVIISKMKTGMPPGPDNPTTETTIFNKTDGIEIDFRGVKSDIVGEYYIDFIDATTGELTITTNDRMKTEFKGQDTGMGTDLASFPEGEYDLNVNYNKSIIYSTQITIK